MQPGGHRFEPGILHHVWRIGSTPIRGQANASRLRPGAREHSFEVLELAKASSHGRIKSFTPKPKGDGGSLTTEYPANGSSFLNHRICRNGLTPVPWNLPKRPCGVEVETGNGIRPDPVTQCKKRGAVAHAQELERGGWGFRVPDPEFRVPRARVSFRLVVKLLRAYGECLGARSR